MLDASVSSIPCTRMQNPPDISHADWLRAPATQIVFTALAQGGYRARAVGGAVRNSLMDRPVNDIDIATEARPENVARLCAAAGLAVHETGLQHGTVTVVSSDVPYEVTTLRTDVETDGRHATVAFTTDWCADAARRDFTINALYCDPDGTIYDPLKGYPDIAAQKVRFIGDATARIREDYLRILRFFRFSAIFGDGTLDEVGLAAATAAQTGLDDISAERVRSEVLKVLIGPQTIPVMQAMLTTGILERVLGTELDFDLFRRIVEMENALAPRVAAHPVRRLSALVGTSSTGTGNLARRLRLSNDERKDLQACGRAVSLDLMSPKAIRVGLYRQGAKTVEHAAVLQGATRKSAAFACSVLDAAQDWDLPALPVSGADLLARGDAPGPELGKALRELEARWIASDFALTREELLSK